jgi:hypothetical protein
MKLSYFLKISVMFLIFAGIFSLFLFIVNRNNPIKNHNDYFNIIADIFEYGGGLKRPKRYTENYSASFRIDFPYPDPFKGGINFDLFNVSTNGAPDKWHPSYFEPIDCMHGEYIIKMAAYNAYNEMEYSDYYVRTADYQDAIQEEKQCEVVYPMSIYSLLEPFYRSRSRGWKYDHKYNGLPSIMLYPFDTYKLHIFSADYLHISYLQEEGSQYRPDLNTRLPIYFEELIINADGWEVTYTISPREIDGDVFDATVITLSRPLFLRLFCGLIFAAILLVNISLLVKDIPDRWQIATAILLSVLVLRQQIVPAEINSITLVDGFLLGEIVFIILWSLMIRGTATNKPESQYVSVAEITISTKASKNNKSDPPDLPLKPIRKKKTGNNLNSTKTPVRKLPKR